MSKMKGSAFTHIRESMKKQSPEVQKIFLDSLSIEARKEFESALAFAWIPVSIVTEIYEKSGSILYPGDRKSSLRKVGKANMISGINGVYRVALHFTSLSFAMEQSARMWSTYQDTGKASCEKCDSKNELAFVVRNYPNYPSTLIETIAGSVEGILELCNCKNPKVVYHSEGAIDHKWIASWG